MRQDSFTKKVGMQEIFRDPTRTTKPRESGITHVIDKGMSVQDVADLCEVTAGYVDIIKFGWATSVVIENLDAKIAACQKRGIAICCGGTLFEIAYHRGKLEEYVAFLKDRGFKLMEISDGVIDLPEADKLRLIERLARDFRSWQQRQDGRGRPLSVGEADQERAQRRGMEGRHRRA